ncbi:MAG: hypothetical protein JNL33_08850 [Betaproteobacteria bacterium]|nr:hypothetical protein [Betaproteobacteria bacterium]
MNQNTGVTGVDAAALLRRALASAAAAGMTQRAPYLSARVVVGVDEAMTLVQFHEGRLELRERVPLLCPWDFAIRGGAAAWLAYWAPVPEPGSHDLFALSKRGLMSFEGDLRPFMAHLQFFKDLLALPRGERRA